MLRLSSDKFLLLSLLSPTRTTSSACWTTTLGSISGLSKESFCFVMGQLLSKECFSSIIGHEQLTKCLWLFRNPCSQEISSWSGKSSPFHFSGKSFDFFSTGKNLTVRILAKTASSDDIFS